MHHVLAVSNSPLHKLDNYSGLRHGWPRLPLPADPDVLAASAELGLEVARLLDVERSQEGTRESSNRLPRRLGVLESSGAVSLDPQLGGLGIDARWGLLGKDGVCMPGPGKLVERRYEPEETSAIEKSAKEQGLTLEQAVQLLGETTYDVYLNDVAYWRNLPASVWKYTIGGYQVIKKWLSYREKSILGRDLKPEEARYVTEMVQQIAALILLQPKLDENYRRCKDNAFDWSALDT
ncbi:MAG: hypothetical protein C4521_11050 [Actinobacteria bacterium]|nr:MAG: hypothetical protein C4521_11050 [Actinomycetota bacterium]